MTCLHILILGGTTFLGPYLVEELHRHGHRITLFHRGRQPPLEIPRIENLQGDIAQTKSEVCWVSEEFLRRHQVSDWGELPL